jgi:nucleotide-binding universal stress UspA family protein
VEGPIVVGTDGSESATEAVVEATKLAKTFEQPLHIVCAYHLRDFEAAGIPGEFAGTITSLDRVESLLGNVASVARSAGAKVVTHAVAGDPAEALIDLASNVNTGIIVVGNKGIGSLRRFVLGNVPSKVVHHSPCSTYVVHTT